MSENIDEETEVEVEEPLGNPAPPPDVDLEKLRGDRIGDTVFSGKWCIQTVMKLMQSNVVLKADAGDNADDVVDMEEELQNEVGALWDMTSNVQVCQYLHSVGAVESICYVISNSRCPRATEMCVGMLANIIYHNELWDIMKGDTAFFSILIQLLTSTDQPVLLELNRFFNTALCHQNSDVFYSSLNENGQLVVQELLRILSGSTNGELLKQVSELVYGLMYRDQDDSHFNTRFADPDFLMAVVEASKELGLNHESSGQNYIMEIFHIFTTYEAGIEAIGSALEEVCTSGMAYLRTVCQQGLSLATTCQVLTAMLSTLHHVMSRSTAAKESLLASPSFLHCVLITLVALYRKLGLYRAISHPSHNRRASRRHQLQTSDTTWQSQEDREEEDAEVTRQHREEPSGDVVEKRTKSPSSGAGGTNNPQGSWSERAFAAGRSGVADSEVTTFRTPEASPRPAYKSSGRATRELEVSWSERRLASPLVLEDDEVTENWKQPRERRKFKKRDGDGGDKEKKTTQTDGSETEQVKKDVNVETFQQELLEKVSHMVSTEASAGSSDGGPSLTEHNNQASDAASMSETAVKEEAQQLEDSSNTLKAMRIQSQSRAATDSRLSGGFVPSALNPDLEQAKDNFVADKPEQNLGNLNRLKDTSNVKASDDSREYSTSPSSSTDVRMSNQPLTAVKDGDKHDNPMVGMDVGFEEDEEEGGELNQSVGGSSGHKYRTLLGVIRDFLVDYLSSMEQVSGEKDGIAPIVTATMKYLDHQCSSTELRAMTVCVRDALGVDTSQDYASVEDGRLALQRLLSLCDSFQASHLKSVLIGCVANGGS